MTHVMTLISEHEGTEEWYCAICGRRLLMEWNPFKVTVIEAGDETVNHTGGRGMLK